MKTIQNQRCWKWSDNYLLLLSIPVLLIIWLSNQSFYDQGDSVMHYLIAHGASKHPLLYLDLWGKPLFTLLASGFTRWGWMGMKVFNLLTILGAGFAIFMAMRRLQPALAVWATLLFWFSPQIMLVSASGLTEPLFACLLAFALLAWVNQYLVWASILCSLLPLIRSEGMVLILIWMMFLLISRQWKKIPWLFLGIFLVSIAGMFVAGKSLFWFFLENPYPLKAEIYGSGSFLHYFKNYLSLAGLPHYLLFLAGCSALLIQIFRSKDAIRDEFKRTQLLILSLCLGFFLFHSFAWGMGLMGSFGMIRVLISVMPLAAMIAAWGGYTLIQKIPIRWRSPLGIGYVGWILAFPFTPSIYSIQTPLNRLPKAQEQVCLRAASFSGTAVKSDQACFYYEAPLLTLGLRNLDSYTPPLLDYFDRQQRRSIREYKAANPGDILIWDSWFAAKEAGITSEELDRDSLNLERIGQFEQSGKSDFQFRIYRVRPKLKILAP